MERLDGTCRIGPLNASFCIDPRWNWRCSWVGCVALRTSHWGRAGTCGCERQRDSCDLLDHTPPNMPAWGNAGGTRSVGNIHRFGPRRSGEHSGADMRSSSRLPIGNDRARTSRFPVPVEPTHPRGHDRRRGNLSRRPASGLSDFGRARLAILLDAFAAIHAVLRTHILKPGSDDLGVSQVYLAFQPKHLGVRGQGIDREILTILPWPVRKPLSGQAAADAGAARSKAVCAR